MDIITNFASTSKPAIVWTLESFYHLPREDIKEKVLAILNTPGLQVVDGELVLRAIIWYAEKNVDFIDAYNAAWMQARGIKAVAHIGIAANRRAGSFKLPAEQRKGAGSALNSPLPAGFHCSGRGF